MNRQIWKHIISKYINGFSHLDEESLLYLHDKGVELVLTDYKYSKEVLNNTYKLTLRDSDIEDVGCLANIHTLELNGCSKITDVSSLGRVHNLSLICLEKVVDISMLDKVNVLRVCRCKYRTSLPNVVNVFCNYSVEQPSGHINMQPLGELYFKN